MIKAIIADVDGVMVGKQEGVNFPLPPDEIIEALRRVAHSGVPIVLCTAKFRVAIDEIIVRAQLNNPHITDGGALIIHPLGEKKIITQTVIDESAVQDYLSHNEVYTELYSATDYFISQGSDQEFRRKRAKLLQMEPKIVPSLADIAKRTPIIKIISYAENEDDKPRIETQVTRLNNRLAFIWSHHPFILPRIPCVITAPGISKAGAAQEVADYLGLAFDEMLGIGDSPADSSFMQRCKYVATVGDDPELRRLASQKDHWYAGGSVDDNALLDIFDHFGLYRV